MLVIMNEHMFVPATTGLPVTSNRKGGNRRLRRRTPAKERPLWKDIHRDTAHRGDRPPRFRVERKIDRDVPSNLLATCGTFSSLPPSLLRVMLKG